MTNPYADLPDDAFWRTGVVDRLPEMPCPIPGKTFAMRAGARVATAGSCFAQNLGPFLNASASAEFLQSEDIAPGQPVFSALYGNIYTMRQLLQLFEEAFSIASLDVAPWKRPDGRFVDPFRPFVEGEGFESQSDVADARSRHLTAVRRVFTDCDAFVLTLGLTEAWVAPDGTVVFPVAPGVVTDDAAAAGEFHNFTYTEVICDLEAFVGRLGAINPAARIILSVSPVPLTATYSGEHVLVASCHSKAVLRAVCSEAVEHHANVFYFPSYDIISSHITEGRFFDHNRRTITADGVAHVMRVFEKTFLTPTGEDEHSLSVDVAVEDVVCDEDEIVKTIGF